MCADISSAVSIVFSGKPPCASFVLYICVTDSLIAGVIIYIHVKGPSTDSGITHLSYIIYEMQTTFILIDFLVLFVQHMLCHCLSSSNGSSICRKKPNYLLSSKCITMHMYTHTEPLTFITKVLQHATIVLLLHLQTMLQ